MDAGRAGHALFVDSPLTDGVRVYADNVALARFLQKEIEYLLYKPFGAADIPVIAATFDAAVCLRKRPANFAEPSMTRSV